LLGHLTISNSLPHVANDRFIVSQLMRWATAMDHLLPMTVL
jgi:hypothetical protein